MPRSDFFQRLGLYAASDFLDDELRNRILSAMDGGSSSDGTVGSATGEFAVDPSYRRTKVVDVGDDLRSAVQAHLLARLPEIETHYGVRLGGCQPPQFLAYRPGDFYKAHRDRNPSGAMHSQARCISAVIFLNPRAEAPAAGTYGGGALTFYEWLTDPTGRDLGLPLDADAGLLMTFRAEALHAVAPVTHGERRTIVSWYTSA